MTSPKGAIPGVFCWTKYGAEAGEGSEQIFRRKEAERKANDGLFLWGIGNSLGPSILCLLGAVDRPEVLFSPMTSRPAARDVSPEFVRLWRRAQGQDGSPYEIPAYSLVTSGPSSRRVHYALVCHSEEPLGTLADGDVLVSPAQLRNLRSGAMLGASQVTSVVSYAAGAALRGTTYPVTARAQLVPPYVVRLYDDVVISNGVARDLSAGDATFARLAGSLGG